MTTHDPHTSLSNATTPEASVARALVTTGSPPWVGWFLVSLIRYRERQRWIYRQLGPRALWADSYKKELESAPGWRLFAHGTNVKIDCPETGESIALSADDGTFEARGHPAPDTVRAYDFADWIKSLVVGAGDEASDRSECITFSPEMLAHCTMPASNFPEARVWRWMPSGEFLVEFFDVLESMELVRPVGPERSYRLSETLEVVSAVVATDDFADPRVASRWMADLGDTEVDPSRLSERLAIEHTRWVQDLMRSPRWGRKYTALPVLAIHVEPVELAWTCDALLDEEDGCEGVLRFLVHRSHLPMSRAVARLLGRLPVARHNLLRLNVASEYLVARGAELPLVRDKLVAFAPLIETAAEFEPEVDVAPFVEHIHLALSVAPAHALELIQRALRRDCDDVVKRVAAALVVANERWCARELESAYRDAPPHVGLLREALGLLANVPQDIPRAIGGNRVTREVEFNRHFFRPWPTPALKEFDTE